MRQEKLAEIKEHELIDAEKQLTEAAPEVKKSKSRVPRKPRSMFEPGDEVKL